MKHTKKAIYVLVFVVYLFMCLSFVLTQNACAEMDTEYISIDWWGTGPAALLSALAEAGDSGIPIKFESKDYDMTGLEITVTNDNVHLIGGPNTRLLNAVWIAFEKSFRLENIRLENWSKGIYRLETYDDVAFVEAVNCKFINTGYGILSSNNNVDYWIDRVIINQCTFDCAWAGASFPAKIRHGDVQRNIFQNISKDTKTVMALNLGTTGATGYSTNITVQNNTFKNIGPCGPGLDSRAILVLADNSQIINNHIDTVTGTTGGIEGIYMKGSNNKIAGNYVVNAGNEYIKIKDFDSIDNIVESNTCKGEDGQGIYVVGKNAVKGNIVEITNGKGIEVRGGVVTITDNQVDTLELPLYVTDTVDSVVSGNKFLSGSTYAVRFGTDDLSYSVENSIITNNVVRAVTYGLKFDNPAKDTKVIYNNIDAAIHIDGSFEGDSLIID